MRTRRPWATLVAAVVTSILLAMGVASAPRASAGDAAALEVSQLDVSGYPKVAATVTLPSSLADSGLGADAFSIDEGGRTVPARVSRLPGDQLAVVLAVDTSGSMAGAGLDGAKAAATAFLDRLPADARVAVVGFGASPEVASPLSTDRTALRAALSRLTARGETSLYDAVGASLEQLGTGAGTRRHIVLVSDGRDTVSSTTLDAVTSRLAGAGVGLDVVELATADTDHAALTRLAQAGGGRVVAATDPAALAAIYETLGRGLANQYHLEFEAAGHGPTPVRVVVAHGDQKAEATVTVDLPTAATTTPTGEVTTPAPPPSTVVTAAPVHAGGFGGWALASGAGLCFAALLIGMSSFLVTRRERRPLRPAAALGLEPAGSSSFVARLTKRATAATEGALERHGRRGRLNDALERAGVALRPGEFVVLVGAAATLALIVGSLLGGPLLALTLAILAALVGPAVVAIAARRRRCRFGEQLADNLQLLSGSLRTGYGIVQAIDVVGREAEAPASEEFRRVVVETRLGRDLADSLQAMRDRVGGDDLGWVVEAIEINRQVGGDLAEVLDNVADTIRERDRVRRQVRAVSAEGRLSAYVLVALPLALAAGLAVMNPDYFGELTHGVGLGLVAAGVVMLAIGSFWLSRMVKVKF